jgi:hypothetical protein
MFAPSPIQIRYGDNGVLGQAAAAVGHQNGFNQQKALDMRFLSDEATRRQQSYEYAQNNEMEGRKLQLAHDQLLAREQPAQSYTGGGGVSPFTQAVSQAKQLSLAKSQGTVSDTDAPLLHAAASDPSVDAPQFVEMLNKSMSRRQKETQQAGDKQAKQAFIKQIGSKLPPEEATALQVLADSDEVDLPKLRVAVSEAMSRHAVLPRTKLAYDVQGVDNQMRQIRERMQQVSGQMQKLGVNPEASPAELNPTYADPNAATFNTLGIKGSMVDSPFIPGSGNLVSGGNPDGMKALMIYAGLKHQLDQLQAQRDSAIAGDQQQPQQQGGKPITPQIAAQFIVQANGDKNAARQMALQAGYSF